MFGSAIACRRAARFGVLPTTACSRNRTLATADHHQAGGDANADRERLFRVRLEPCNSGDDIEPRAHGSLGIVLVRTRIAEIGQYPVAPEIGKEAVIG